MREVQADAASLPDLLDAVEQGETVVITREGRPVARLVPDDPGRRSASEPDVFEQIRTFRRTMPRISVEEILAWRHEGHHR